MNYLTHTYQRRLASHVAGEDGYAICGCGAKAYKFTPGKGGEWKVTQITPAKICQRCIARQARIDAYAARRK